MRRLFKKLLEILDGTPAVYGKRQRGQSMVELALVTPLLIILLAGLAEIGYFAQNYLNLIEVTRVGARTGTVQQGGTDPLRWDPLATAPPTDLNGVIAIRNCDPSDERAYLGFYNFLSCIMIRSMDPLPFRDPIAQIAATSIIPPPEVPIPNGVDDIVISAFAVQTVIPSSLGGLRNDVDWPLNDVYIVLDGNAPSDAIRQTVIVGRYPTNANRCTEIGERDPFDWITDGDLTSVTTADGPQYLELREITIQGNPVDPPELRGSGLESTPRHENQRGYMWNGQHLVSGTTNCFGSEWSTKRVEQLINLQGFNLQDGSAYWDNGDLRTYVPSQGIILVEMHWRHETLSQYVGLGAALSPVFAILGEEVTMSVWSAFPLPTVEPRIKF